MIVVEHDEEAILAADHVIDLGPGAGERRRLVAQVHRTNRGNPPRSPGSTSPGTPHRAARPAHAAGSGAQLRIVGARANNLKT